MTTPTPTHDDSLQILLYFPGSRGGYACSRSRFLHSTTSRDEHFESGIGMAERQHGGFQAVSDDREGFMVR